jgi:hypothetical protein
MYSRSAKGGEKGDPNRNPWLAKMVITMNRMVIFPLHAIYNTLIYVDNKLLHVFKQNLIHMRNIIL